MRRRSLYRTERPLGPLARAYLGALLEGDRERAMALVLRAESRGMTARRLCGSVFLPVRHELFAMYTAGRISRTVSSYVAFEIEAAVAHLFGIPAEEQREERARPRIPRGAEGRGVHDRTAGQAARGFGGAG